MFFVTSLLSPVSTITLIPESFNFFIDSLAEGFGGSRNPTKPSKIMLFSSVTEKDDILSILFFLQSATTLKPSSFNLVANCFICSFIL
ncbi:hypothetical protein D3C72_1270610 [compost metagenome]